MSTPPNAQVCTLAFLVKGDLTLLAMKKRGFGEGLWNGVGGKVDADEPIEQAMIRESQEEIGVTPTAYEKVAVHEFVYQEGGQVVHVHTYLCTEWLGEPMETEEMMPQWFSKTAIPYDEMWADDQHWLPIVLDGKKVHTKFVFDASETLVDGKIHEATELENHG